MIKKLRSFTGREKAFTLVELLIVIAIIAILTVAFLPNVLKAPAKARDATRLKQVNDIVSAIEVYATEKGEPPDSAAASPFCFTQAMADIIGINLPKDSKGSGSCDPDDANKNLFYYRYNEAVDPKFYIIAAKLESNSQANTGATKTLNAGGGAGGFNGVASLTDAKAFKGSVPAADQTDFYYISVGPQ